MLKITIIKKLKNPTIAIEVEVIIKPYYDPVCIIVTLCFWDITINNLKPLKPVALNYGVERHLISNHNKTYHNINSRHNSVKLQHIVNSQGDELGAMCNNTVLELIHYDANHIFQSVM